MDPAGVRSPVLQGDPLRPERAGEEHLIGSPTRRRTGPGRAATSGRRGVRVTRLLTRSGADPVRVPARHLHRRRLPLAGFGAAGRRHSHTERGAGPGRQQRREKGVRPGGEHADRGGRRTRRLAGTRRRNDARRARDFRRQGGNAARVNRHPRARRGGRLVARAGGHRLRSSRHLHTDARGDSGR